MNKNYLALFLAFLFYVTGFSQQTVSIGGEPSSGSYTVNFPITSCYAYSYSQQIVKASEFSQGNGTPGMINKIRWYHNTGSPTNTNAWNVWTVYLATTTTDAYSGTSSWIPLNTFTQVYSGQVTPVMGSWMEITLQTPFHYDGTSNLVVAVKEEVSGYACSARWGKYQATGSQGIYYASDSAQPNMNTMQSAAGTTSSVAQMQFDVAPASSDYCVNINSTSVSHTNVSGSEVNIGFAGGLSDNISYAVTTSLQAPSAATGTVNQGATTLNLSNLSANTQYYLWYKKECSPTQSSNWGYYPFKTICGVVNTSFYEGFETTTTGSYTNNIVPDCWTYLNTVTPSTDAYGYVSTTASYGSSGSKGFYAYRSSTSTGKLLLISPQTDNLGNGTKRLRFRAKKSASAYVPKFEIYTMNGTTENATSTLVQEVTLTTNYDEYIVYLPNTTDDYFAFSFDKEGTYSYVYLDDIYYEDSPSCIPVTSVNVSNVTNSTATVSWTPTISSATATYTWELRTSGEAGSGATGLVQTGTTAAGVTTVSLTGLDDSTTYDFYVKANCTTTDSSIWSDVEMQFTTYCNYPVLQSVSATSICGIGTSTITATTSSTGVIQWYLNQNSPAVHQGNEYTTPVIDETTTYYLRTGEVLQNVTTQVGEGTTSTNDTGNPYYYSYSGYKYQYIFTAEELLQAGLAAGPINSLAFEVTTASTVTRNNFRLYIGATTQNTATATHIPVSNLQLVYTNAAQPVAVGMNNFAFTTPFVWDGTSNIVVQTVFSNGGNYDYSNSGAVRTHTAPATRTTCFYSDSATVDGMVNATTVTTGMYYTTTTVRPNMYFNGNGMCMSPFVPVQVVVTESPEFSLSASTATVCQGNPTQPITVAEGLTDYDTFTISPMTGVSGNHQTGWIFAPQENTTYSIIASQSEGVCSKEAILNVQVTDMNYTTLEENYVICEGSALELSLISDSIDESTVQGTLVHTLNFEDNNNLGVTLSGTGTTIAQNTNVHTEGNASLRWGYTNSSEAKLTINETFNAANTYGIVLEFDHIALLEGDSYDYGEIQYSLDGGNTWLNFQQSHYFGSGTVPSGAVRFSRSTYNSWSGQTVPTASMWKSERFFLPSGTADMSNVKIRFTLVSDSSVVADAWYLDNVNISYVHLPEITWAPQTNLYLDQALTQPYTGQNTGKVYFGSSDSGNYPYTATISNTAIGCNVQVNTEVIIPSLVFPGLTDNTYCVETPVEDLVFNSQNGVEYKWYSNIYSQTPLETIPYTGTYYVQIKAGNCVSTRQPVDITIIANVTVTPNQEFCQGATVSQLVATASNNAAVIQWFDSADATQPLAPDTELQAGTYYVNQLLQDCESVKKSVTVSLNEMPQALTESSLSVCSNTTVGSVTIEGQSNIHWYNSMTSTTPISNQVYLTSGTYYVSTYAGVCHSERVPITVEVIQNLAQPQVNVIDICGSGLVSDLDQYVSGVSTAATLRWYNSSTSTTPLNATAQLQTGTYYVEQYLSGCTSTRKAVAVRVTSKAAPTIPAQQVCQGTTIAQIAIPTPSGVVYKWYSTPSSTIELPSTTVLTTGNYYVRREQYGCVSDVATVSVTVNSLPSAPTGESVQELPQGSTVADIVMNQTGIVWYISQEDALTGNNPLQSIMPLVDGQTYYAVLVNSTGCRSIATPVTINLFLGINDLDMVDLKVYPNPTEDILNVTYKESIDYVEVYSIIGQKVIDKKVNTTDVQLDLSHLSSGSYIIKVVVGQNSQLIKIVKK